ncbi:Hypothetical protein CKL_2202 [Clostridium kluyveri DSM 555]|uniref:Phosphoribosyltransferase domain-containing protein n=1 Tax=Clostridium kluyveri (strain ATCC 8527 / DSM 555 / NBRC 12016 / NCIMB 10680 / K1) TaxID=431943 RepID=A5MZB8_CLOK5|nr:Hypothetical protein CKL_2202 [Clostridium kluyveri DSM 555]
MRYYINFVDIMYSSLNRDICSMLAAFIKEKLGKNINKVEKIVVSENGNFLLGLGVSEELNKAFVKMLPEPRIIKKQYWEGTFKSDENIIIVHDVLVTAKQIIESIEHFPSPHKNIGIFCLVNRTDHEGKKELNNKGIEVFAILELSDNDIGMMFINNKTKEGV